MSDNKYVADYLMDSSLVDEAVDCRRHGYVLTGKFLGQGAYANVYLGHATPEKIQTNFKLRRSLGDQKELKVAIKIISTTTAPQVYINKFLPREVATMNKCYHHQNVIQLYDIFATHKRIYLVLEYAECGDLLTYVNNCYSRRMHSARLTEDKARMMFRDILCGVQFVHLRGVAHRDLKCENILLAKNHRAKLSDFGFAIEPRHNRELLKTHCGSYAYAPPEILRQQKYDGKLADLWSLGVILFAMVNGGLPFKESGAKAVLSAMKKPVYFKGYLSQECRELIRGLLRIKPHKRLSVEEVLAHAWMKKQPPLNRDDKNAFGDISLREASLDKYPGSTLQDLCALGRAGDGFDKPENVLRYIKKCMTNTAGSKQSTKHSGTVPKFEKPKLPDKPFFLQNILNTDSPGDPSNFVLPNPPEKALTNLPSANKTKAPHCHGKRPVYKAFANEVLAAKIRNENRASDASRKEQMTKPNHFKTALPQVNDHREQTSSMSGLKSPYKMEHKTFAGRSLESSTAVTKSRGSEEEGSHNLLKTEATTPAKKPTDLSEFSKVHKSQKGCSNPDSNKVASPKIVNINMKTTLDPITNRQKVNISNISISKHGKKQWRKKNTSSSSAFNRRNHPRLGGALSVPPPGQHQNGTNVLKEIYHMPWPGKPKEYQTNVTRCPGIQQNEPNTVQKDLSVSPNKTKLSLEKQTPKIPHLTDNTSHKQAIFSPISHSSQHSKNTPSPYYTSKKNQQVTSTPDYYFRDVSCVTSQAWSGGLPASTTLTAFPTSLSRHVRSTGSTNTENLRESSGVGKLLVKRAQVTRNLLQTVPVRGDNYVLHKFPDHSLNMIKSGRAVLRMRNKR